MDNERRGHSQSLPNPRSESKVMVGQKRDLMEGEDTSASSHKRVKLGDVNSVWPSKEEDKVTLGKKLKGWKLDAVQEGTGHNSAHLDFNSNPGALDVNGTVTVGIEESNKNLASLKEQKNRGFDLDLNAEDISSSIDNDPFYPFKNHDHLKSRDESECGSSVGPLDEKDSMRLWKGLKRNNYMTSPHGKLPMPITQARMKKKSSDNLMKKKIELTKREQVDRFAKVAAPSGLLNGLNPGIINHVRNSKQVHSIIEALVRSERTQNRHSVSNQIKDGQAEIRVEGGINMNHLGLLGKCIYLNSEVKRADDDVENKSGGFAMKLSSSISENTSCLSKEESGNLTSVTSLSVKAANVASQWLELLNQDIRGRLAALRRSKKRVRAVITTELPLLMSKEFPFKDSCMTNASGDAHAVRWSNIFGQMDKALSEEESHLENWLKQVKEMQLQCEKGLYSSSCNASQEMGPVGNNDRLGESDNSDKDLAVRAAAAASIYSTCNFLSTVENLPCC